MPKPTQMLKGRGRRGRKITLVGQHPERVIAGVALSDGEAKDDPQVSFFEVLERDDKKLGGPWVHLQNMELKESQWFRLEDCYELRIVGNAHRIKEQQGWAL